MGIAHSAFENVVGNLAKPAITSLSGLLGGYLVSTSQIALLAGFAVAGLTAAGLKKFQARRDFMANRGEALPSIAAAKSLALDCKNMFAKVAADPLNLVRTPRLAKTIIKAVSLGALKSAGLDEIHLHRDTKTAKIRRIVGKVDREMRTQPLKAAQPLMA